MLGEIVELGGMAILFILCKVLFGSVWKVDMGLRLGIGDYLEVVEIV